jgi:hypothetical protein
VIPLGQVARQQTHLVQGRERAEDPLLGSQDPEEEGRGLRPGTVGIVDQVQVLADQTQGRTRQRYVVLLGGSEGAQQPLGMLLQVRAARNLQVVAHLAEAVGHGLRRRHREQRTRPCQALLEDEIGIVANHAGVPVEVAHEALHRQVPGGVLRTVAEPQRKLLLAGEAHLVAASPRHPVQLVAHPPQEVQRALQLFQLREREQTGPGKAAQAPGGRLHGAHHPQGAVVVTQSPLPFLDVGLEQVEGLSELRVSLLSARRLSGDELVGPVGEAPGDQALELLDESGIAGQTPGVQDRRGHGDVLPGQLAGLLRGTDRAADGEASVPEPILDLLGHGSRGIRQGVRMQKEEIHVRVERHLPTPESTDRNHGQGLGLAARALGLGPCVELGHEMVQQVRSGAIREGAGTALQMDLAQVRAHGLQEAPQRSHRRGLAVPCLEIVREVGGRRHRRSRATTGAAWSRYRAMPSAISTASARR